MMGYFGMWGMFSMIICQGLEQVTRICRVVFALMTAFLLSLSIAHATGNTAFLHGAALIGITGSLPGLYLGIRYVFSEAMHLAQNEAQDSNRVRS
jgi:succinate-acetate transporter protein